MTRRWSRSYSLPTVRSIASSVKNQDPKQIWKIVLGTLELQVSRPSYATWLKDTVGLSMNERLFEVATPSMFVANWLELRMSSLIEATILEVTGKALPVKFQVSTSALHELPPGDPASQLTGPTQNSLNRTPATARKPIAKLNPRYTLDSFVVGSSNQLAYAAAMAVCTNPGSAYNPLFLYGGVGLGKTHLLHGIGNATTELGLTTLYVSSEQFTNEFIGSIQNKRTGEFRDKYRSVDVLLLDDVQFMRGKETIQESFFHTFNALHNSGSQIVIASDRSSIELFPLEERLLSRFQWGLSADIRVPDQATRLAILQAKAVCAGKAIPGEVLQFISQKFSGSVRSLEGALNRVVAYSELTATPLGLQTAELTLQDLIPAHQPSVPTKQAILTAVCAKYSVDPAALKSKRRDATVVLARHVAAYFLQEFGQLTLREIAREMGNRDHSTIRHACASVKARVSSSPQLAAQLADISKSLDSTPSN